MHRPAVTVTARCLWVMALLACVVACDDASVDPVLDASDAAALDAALADAALADAALPDAALPDATPPDAEPPVRPGAAPAACKLPFTVDDAVGVGFPRPAIRLPSTGTVRVALVFVDFAGYGGQARTHDTFESVMCPGLTPSIFDAVL